MSIEERIEDKIENLSPKQKRLARFVLDNKTFMSFAPAVKAAEKTGTSAATVVRFAQAIGYEGFSDMQDDLRAELPRSHTTVERMQARLEHLPNIKETPDKIFATDIRNIERTARKLSQARLDQVIDEILTAERILVVGAGLSEGIAIFLAHSLKVIGFDARAVIGSGISQATELSAWRPCSLLIAISLWRYVRSTYQAVDAAQRAGVPTLAITDSIVSPLAKKVDYAFEVATENIDHSLSTTAVISFINVLVAALTRRIPEKALESLRRVDEAYRAGDLLLVD